MKEKVVSYLDQLKFDPKLWNTFPAKYVVNIRFVLLLIISIVVIGTFSFINIPRRVTPEVKIPIILVTTVLPGASPEEIESLVTIPLEDKLSGIKGLDAINSTSGESVSSIRLDFVSSIDVEKARADVQSLVDQVNSLPTDAKAPTVASFDIENQPIWTFALTTDGDYASLARFSKVLEERIKNVSKVDRVTLSGFEEQEIEVVMNLEKIREFGVTPIQLSQAVSKAASSYPAGNVNTTSSTFSIAINKDISTIEDIRNLHIMTPAGVGLKLSDIASVSERSKPEQNRAFFASKNVKPQRAIQFSVYKISSANIDASEEEVRKVVEETLAEYNNRFELVTVTNNAEDITEQFSELFGEFRATIILVFILLLIFLGLRQAIISSLTVPLTFLSTFAIIDALGLSLNSLTMFAFLIALGLLIDDTIVVVAAMTRYYRTGKFTPTQTGILIWKDFFVALWSTTITTIWAFVPLLLASGIIGEYIKSIPIVVTATLLSSTTIAVVITIPLMIIFLKPQFPRRVSILLRVILGIIAAVFLISVLPKDIIFLPLILIFFFIFVFVTYHIRASLAQKINVGIDKTPYGRKVVNKLSYVVDHGLINIEALSERYMKIIERVLNSDVARRNTLVALVIFAIIAYLLFPFKQITNEFFPKTDSEILYIDVSLPAGTNLSTAKAEQLNLLESLRKIDNITFLIAETGASADGGGGGNNNLLYTLHLPAKEDREISSLEIAQNIREKYKNYSAGTFAVSEPSSGPPAGADVQIQLLGDDLTLLDQYANQVVTYLEKQDGITNVNKSIKSGTSKLTFVPDKVKIAENGLSVDAVALWLRTYASGFTLDTIKMNNEDTDIIFRTNVSSNTPEGLASINIPVLSQGQASTKPSAIPLLALGSLKLESNPTKITREDGKRTLTISASTTQGANATVKNQELLAYTSTIQLPNGYSWKTGGANEENDKSVQSILQAMVLSFMLILVTMVIEFKSFRQTAIAMLLIPLSIPGVFYVFALTGTPLSFPALIGILALFGIVVTHAIVVIEKINENIKEGLPLKEAIIDAAGNRLEPVLLTSLATIVGLIPITISDPLWRGLGGAIIAGLLFSGAIKLFFVPVLYYTWYKGDEEKNMKHEAHNMEQKNI